ncbi:Gryzun, putative trafficking through golgi-domain-containing protein [Scheffersomyces amazonensis]|uniref:Gryzun, putative trafficking through golgi-domain-containing protein n=1 Tax=Scheffersomyces amazonensis TaxID=1078765 RepID=UPI00315D2853
MDNYKDAYLQQLAPYVRVHFNEYESHEVSQVLWAQFVHYSIYGKVWDNGIIKNRLTSVRYIIERIADPEIEIPVREVTSEDKHSILSPFNSESDLFPNGILDDKWFSKYINGLPFAIIISFKLSSELEQLSERISQFKRQCQTQHITFIALIISDNDAVNDEEAINQLRILTGLPRLTGLLYLNISNPNTIKRDCEVLVQSLLTNLKPIGHEFYTNIEYKIKQRNKKYYTIPSTSHLSMKVQLQPKFLATRNLIKQCIINQFINYYNLDITLKLLEQAYQNLIEILSDVQIKLEITTENLSQYDGKLYNQVRTLIDVLALHIVRICFSIEDPIQALRRHEIHVLNVNTIIEKENHCKWTSIQYEWLGQLMKLIPSSILNSLTTNSIRKKSRLNRNILGYFGGIRFDDDDYEIITNPGLVFITAYTYLQDFISIPTKLNYLTNYNNESELSNHKLDLLNNACRLIAKDLNSNFISSQEDSYELYTSLINWLLGEEYLKIKHYRNATENYLACLSKNTRKWPHISKLIMMKLLLCYSYLEDQRLQLCTILKLSSYNFSVPSTSKISQLKFDSDAEYDVSELPNLFKVDVFMANENFSPETSVYDAVLIQFILKSTIKHQSIYKLLPESTEVDLCIKSVEVKVDKLDGKRAKGIKSILINNNNPSNKDKDVMDQSLSIVDLKDISNGNGSELITETNLNYSEGIDNVVQILQTANHSGVYEIQSIILNYTITLTHNQQVIHLDKIEKFIIADSIKSSFPTHHLTYYTVKGPIQMRSHLMGSATSIKVNALKPNLSISLQDASLLNCVILGEKLTIPFKLNFQHPIQKKIIYDKFQLSTNISVLDKSNQKVDEFNIQSNWNDLKDDEVLDLSNLVDTGQEYHKLNVNIFKPPNTNYKSDEGFNICIDIKAIIIENEDEHEHGSPPLDLQPSLIYDVGNYNLPIIVNPFSCRYIISPRLRMDSNDMPSPFLLNSETPTPASMPIATRTWLGKVSFIDNFKLFEHEQPQNLQVVDVEFHIKSSNGDLIVDIINEPIINHNHKDKDKDKEELKYQQLFTIRSKNGYSHRDVQTLTSVIIKWKRLDQESINIYKSEEWKIVLPLSDPRVLLTIVPDKSDSQKCILRYVLENPTPRIFTFTTQLSNEDNQNQWDFSYDDNIVPLRQTPFPVLPFTRHIMEFVSKFTSPDSMIKLPSFKVFDVQYKILLPTLSVDDNITVSKQGLFWNKQLSV